MYFEEFESFSFLQMIGFSVGVAIVFCGVYLLAPTQEDSMENIEATFRQTMKENKGKSLSLSSFIPSFPSLPSRSAHMIK
jgi:hypothetical protein